MKLFQDLFVMMILSVAGCMSVQAQECKPSDFTISDVEKINFSESVKLSAYSMLDHSKSENKSSNFGLGAVVYGIPINLSNEEKKSLSEHVLQKSGYNIDRTSNFSIVSTALSSAGVAMYAGCLDAQNIKVTFPVSAYSEDEFFLNIIWTPRYKANASGNGKVRVINGLAEGEPNYEFEIDQFKSQDVRISKKSNSVVQISISVDGRNYPSIVIPRSVSLAKFTAVKRRGSASGWRAGVGDECTDHAYLVSEVGSFAGNSKKSCQLCVTKSKDGALIQSLTELDASLSSRGAYAEIYTKNNLEVCAKFWTSPAGKGSGRFEVGRGSNLTVWEIVPEER